MIRVYLWGIVNSRVVIQKKGMELRVEWIFYRMSCMSWISHWSNGWSAHLLQIEKGELSISFFAPDWSRSFTRQTPKQGLSKSYKTEIRIKLISSLKQRHYNLLLQAPIIAQLRPPQQQFKLLRPRLSLQLSFFFFPVLFVTFCNTRSSNLEKIFNFSTQIKIPRKIHDLFRI